MAIHARVLQRSAHSNEEHQRQEQRLKEILQEAARALVRALLLFYSARCSGPGFRAFRSS